MLYWRIGKRIQEDVLKSERAEYGQKVITTVVYRLLSVYDTLCLSLCSKMRS
ncbi:MAG: DUF1016 domain-containing protein [bacterium]|nr:DUF1016 domain-containing protein [bacterium]